MRLVGCLKTALVVSVVMLVTAYCVLVQEWYSEVVVFFIAALIGAVLWDRPAQKDLKEALHHKHWQLTEAQGRARCDILSAYRKDMSNYLMTRDPMRFLDLHYKLKDELDFISGLSLKELNAQEQVLVSKYPLIEYFNAINTREFIICGDDPPVPEDVERVYIDNVKLQHINYLLDKETLINGWDPPELADDPDYLDDLAEYAKRVADTKLKQALNLAYKEYTAYRRGTNFESSESYQTDWFRVEEVYHVADHRWGFHFFKTNDFGLVTSFVDDKEYVHFYRSDEKFEEEIFLHDLNMDRLIANIT